MSTSNLIRILCLTCTFLPLFVCTTVQAASEADEVKEVYERAQDLNAQGDYAASEAVIRSALKTRPDNINLLIVLADSLNGSGDSDGAIAAYKRVLEKGHPRPVTILPALCSAEVQKGQFSAAKGHCEKALQLGAGGTVHFNLGKINSALKNYDKARSYYQKYVELFEAKQPNDPFVLEAKYEAERLKQLSQSSKNERQPKGSKEDKGVDFTAAEEDIMAKIVARYVRLGQSETEARQTVNDLRSVWIQVPRAQRIVLMQQMLQQLEGQ